MGSGKGKTKRINSMVSSPPKLAPDSQPLSIIRNDTCIIKVFKSAKHKPELNFELKSHNGFRITGGLTTSSTEKKGDPLSLFRPIITIKGKNGNKDKEYPVSPKSLTDLVNNIDATHIDRSHIPILNSNGESLFWYINKNDESARLYFSNRSKVVSPLLSLKTTDLYNIHKTIIDALYLTNNFVFDYQNKIHLKKLKLNTSQDVNF